MERSFFEQVRFLQKIHFRDSPFHIFARSVQSMPIHMHNGVEFLYVLKGRVKIKISFNHYELNEGDFLLINTFEVHALEALPSTDKEQESLLLILQCDEQMFGKEEHFFAFDPFYYQNYHQEQVIKVKSLMVELYVNAEKVSAAKQAETVMREIAEICLRFFQIQHYDIVHKSESPFHDSHVKMDRIGNTFRYFYLEFDNKIQLEQVAEREYIDKYYASHLIKSGTGSTFQNMLNIVRVDRAEVLLLGTDLPIREVAEKSGFSSYTYFIQQFKDYYHMTPVAYRKTYCKEIYPRKEMKFTPLPVEETLLKQELALAWQIPFYDVQEPEAYILKEDQQAELLNLLQKTLHSQDKVPEWMDQIFNRKIKQIIIQWAEPDQE